MINVANLVNAARAGRSHRQIFEQAHGDLYRWLEANAGKLPRNKDDRWLTPWGGANPYLLDRWLYPTVPWEDRPFVPEKEKDRIRKLRDEFVAGLKSIAGDCSAPDDEAEAIANQKNIEDKVVAWANRARLHEMF